MKEYNRLQNSFFSLASGMVYRIITLLTAFVVRTVFVNCLSTDYLGVNGLCTNILSMLSLAELGFGTAMVYSMYKPLAEKDYNKLQQLMDLYKKVYAIIGTVIFLLLSAVFTGRCCIILVFCVQKLFAYCRPKNVYGNKL